MLGMSFIYSSWSQDMLSINVCFWEIFRTINTNSWRTIGQYQSKHIAIVIFANIDRCKSSIIENESRCLWKFNFEFLFAKLDKCKFHQFPPMFSNVHKRFATCVGKTLKEQTIENRNFEENRSTLTRFHRRAHKLMLHANQNCAKKNHVNVITIYNIINRMKILDSPPKSKQIGNGERFFLSCCTKKIFEHFPKRAKILTRAWCMLCVCVCACQMAGTGTWTIKHYCDILSSVQKTLHKNICFINFTLFWFILLLEWLSTFECTWQHGTNHGRSLVATRKIQSRHALLNNWCISKHNDPLMLEYDSRALGTEFKFNSLKHQNFGAQTIVSKRAVLKNISVSRWFLDLF